MAAKSNQTDADKQAAKDAAKAAAKAAKAEHAEKLGTPDPALVADASKAEGSVDTSVAPEKAGQGDELFEDTTEAETLASKALAGGVLTEAEVKKVAARALGSGSDFEGAMLALAERIRVVEEKIDEINAENTRVMQRMRELRTGRAEKGGGMHGSIDRLGQNS